MPGVELRVGFPEFAWIWNRYNGLTTPSLHIQMSRWLDERWNQGDHKVLLMAFRNSGKSTLVGLFCAWALLRNADLRILVLAADFALAKKMVRNVRRIVERHPLTKNMKPRRTDHWASDQFTIRRTGELRDPSMLAKGIDANITGLRADIVICDDVEVPNTCNTPGKREELRERLQEIEYVLMPNGLQLYIGTPHSYYTIYAEHARSEAKEEKSFLHGFERLELPILDSDGCSRWQERFSLERIAAIRSRTGRVKFESQMMLRPLNAEEGRLDPGLLKSYDDELEYSEGNFEGILKLAGRRLVSATCWWDPSFGSPDGGDGCVIAAVFTDEEGNYWVHRVEYLQHDPRIIDKVDEATQLCRGVVAFVRELYLPAVSLETNGLGKFLPSLLRQEIAASGISCAVIEKTTTRSKDLRIVDAFDAILAAGRLRAHQSVWDTPFIEELREWRPGKKCPDDGIDAVAGCLLSEPVRLRRLFPSSETIGPTYKNWRPGISGIVADTSFQIS